MTRPQVPDRLRAVSPRRPSGNDRSWAGGIRIDCECCRLPQRIRDRDGAIPTTCDECNQHQGNLPDRQVQRAQSHEEMLRIRLAACRKSEAAATARSAEDRAAVAAALASRGALAHRLVLAANLSNHNCAATRIASERNVTAWAERYARRTEAEDDY